MGRHDEAKHVLYRLVERGNQTGILHDYTGNGPVSEHPLDMGRG